MRTKLRDFRALPVVPLSLLGDADSAYGFPFFFLWCGLLIEAPLIRPKDGMIPRHVVDP